MKRMRWVIVPIFFIIACSMLPLAFTEVAQADEGKPNLAELTAGADSVVAGTVVERNSYWNDERTGIYTSVVLSVEEGLKGTPGQDRITVTLPGGEADGIGEWVSDMPSFDQGERAVVFLKKLSTAQLPKTKASKLQFAEEQFEVYRGYQGKFAVNQGKVDNLSEVKFKERIRKVVEGRALQEDELYVPSSTATFPYSYAGFCWPHPPNPVVGYRINQNTTDCTGEGAAVQTAAATWNAPANFLFSYAGTSAATSYSYNGVNEILWRNFGSGGTIAHALIWYSGSTILENDIEFNDYYTWSAAASCPGGQFDVDTIALHELGHWLCLDDLYNPADSAKVMYGYGSTGATKRALHTDDIAGIQSIYGASLIPIVTNSTGASNITSTSARLNGELTSTGGADTTVHICWGDNDGGTGTWDTNVNLGIKTAGAFYTDISSLSSGTTYYYRCYATNSAGSDWADTSAQFTTLVQTQKLIGNGATGSATGGYGYLRLVKYAASGTGQVSEVRVYSKVNGNVKVALYADNSGQPGDLLNASTTSTYCTANQWNSISLPETWVTEGSDYWIAIADESGAGACYSFTDPIPMRYKTITYSSYAFPDPAGSGSTSSDIFYMAYAGWGTETPPAPPTMPTITNASSASNIASTSARLNGEITSTGNENPTVTVYYGTTDGGTIPGNWTNHVDLGSKGLGTFYTDIPGLIPNTPYYYRCYATNSAGSDWADTSAQFTTLVQTQKLIGNGATGSATGGYGYLRLVKYAAYGTGQVREVRVYSQVNGNVKVALYADNSGEPGALLNANNTSTYCTAGQWNSISLPETWVTEGSNYWIAVADESGAGACYSFTDPIPVRYKTITYSSYTFLDPAGSGYTSSGIYYMAYAGWGTETTPAPPETPTLQSPGASITFKWGTSTGATNYQLQVNTLSNFTGIDMFNAEVGNVTTQEVTGLSLGAAYYWRVKAGNAGGWSGWSSVRSVVANSVP